jgi:hypothetical protein
MYLAVYLAQGGKLSGNAYPLLSGIGIIARSGAAPEGAGY